MEGEVHSSISFSSGNSRKLSLFSLTQYLLFLHNHWKVSYQVFRKNESSQKILRRAQKKTELTSGLSIINFH